MVANCLLTTNSINYQSFANTHLNGQLVLYLLIRFALGHRFTHSLSKSSIRPIDRTLSGATTPSEIGAESPGNEGALHIPLISSTKDGLTSYSRHSLREFLLLCRDAVGVFYSASRPVQPYPGHSLGRSLILCRNAAGVLNSNRHSQSYQDTCGGGGLTPLQRCSWCTLQPKMIGSVITGHLLGGESLIPLQRCSRCILQPQPTGLATQFET